MSLKQITSISLTQFRNYGQAGFEFPEKITCITGLNGSGKTNLLDAVYYLCYTKSYFTSVQQQCIQLGMDGFRIEGKFSGGDHVVCKWKNGLKEISGNDSVFEKVTDYIGQNAAVMIAPDDLKLINGGSEERRHWMDGILGQADKQYLEKLLLYQRILNQRKAWLKEQAIYASGDSYQLDYYDGQLSEQAQYIFEKRRKFLDDFARFLERYYRQLSGGGESIRLEYQSDLFESDLLKQLTNSLGNDLRLQRTTRGIHKDELLFLLDGFSTKQYASQGQKKSFLFALKLAQYNWLSQSLGYTPILLLDDVFEKLDQGRMEALLRIIRGEGFGQVIISDTHEDRVAAAFGAGEKINFIRL